MSTVQRHHGTFLGMPALCWQVIKEVLHHGTSEEHVIKDGFPSPPSPLGPHPLNSATNKKLGLLYLPRKLIT